MLHAKDAIVDALEVVTSNAFFSKLDLLFSPHSFNSMPTALKLTFRPSNKLCMLTFRITWIFVDICKI